MLEPHESAQIKGRRRQLDRYSPVVFTIHAERRFDRDRRATLIRRCGGRLNERQALAIEMMIRSEWSELKNTALAKTAETRAARLEHEKLASACRRELLLWDRILTSIIKAEFSANPPPPVDPHDVLKDLHQRYGDGRR